MTGERVTHSEHPNCRCRKCRLVRFAEAVEQLMKDATNDVRRLRDVGSMSSVEYAQFFESSVKELHTQLVVR